MRPLRAVRGADEVSRRSAARRRASRARVAAAPRLEDPQRHAARLPARRAPAIASSISAAGAAARCSGTAISARADRRHRHQPVLRRGGAPRGRSAARGSAAAALCRWHVHEGLVARRARAPVARGAQGDAGRSRPCARSRRRALRLHARAEERAGRGRPARHQRAGASARAGRADRHASGAAAEVGSPQPAARHSRARAGRPIGRVPHRQDPLLHADRRRVRREHHDADGRASHGPARREASRRVSTRRRRRCRGDPRSARIRESANRDGVPRHTQRCARCRSS